MLSSSVRTTAISKRDIREIDWDKLTKVLVGLAWVLAVLDDLDTNHHVVLLVDLLRGILLLCRHAVGILGQSGPPWSPEIRVAK